MTSEPTPEQAITRIQAAFGEPHGDYRTLHAKGAFYEGTFVGTAEAAKRCRALHLQGEEVPVLVRWSNGGGRFAADGAQDVRGMAVSFKLPDGTSTDLLGQTAPRFPVRTPEAFVQMVEAAASPVKLVGFLARHPSALGPLVANGRAKALIAPKSYAEATYYPVHAYRWTAPDGTESWARYVFRPSGAAAARLPDKFSGRDRLREEILARLAAGPARYTVEVQVAGTGDDPHDPMSVWRSTDVFDAGTLTVTGPTADPEENGGLVVFDPTRVVDGIGLSDDPILRYRAGAYSESVTRRVG
ncbi:catalase [Nocardioides stalactiti]|uniref:catalase n=1 Tax=Nocardioides stalactiti TaxID=2755356 RepID=UPI00160295CC|nr:catalase [Nocardioides stalactiti]